MIKSVKEILGQTFLTREAWVFWASSYIILSLMYRSAPYWSSLVLNYVYSTFLFLLLPITVVSFPKEKKPGKLIFWFTALFFSLGPLLAAELFPKIRASLFPPYSPATGPLNGLAVGISFTAPCALIVFTYCLYSGFSLRSIGLGTGKWKFWLPLVSVLVLIMTPVLLYFSKKPDFIATYPLFRHMIKNTGDFWAIDISWFYYLYIWEFFFRGFMLFSLAKKTGPARAIFIQAVVFAFAHLGKPEIEVYSSMIGGVLVGILSYLSGSVLPGALIHWLIAIIMDVFVFFFN
ncbi:CPBP family intramembrane metalloprotease [candidate division WOR-3 bacterium]|nr:CPBP family intramembrane metalloprotease [candidate division WOR-3 bacterium]